MDLEALRELKNEADTKVVLLVLDGLGGAPFRQIGPTELEKAATPNLDRLAVRSVCGLHEPVAPGITPGSGPGHLALFGYDPLRYRVGRGVLSALGIGFDLTDRDVAARGNFATIDADGRVEDRRAGRIPTERNRELVEILREIELPGVEVHVETVREYRFLLVLRGDGLSGEVRDTDPQEVDEAPLDPEPAEPDAERTAELVARFVDEARERLADHRPANGLLLRGFSKRPSWPSFPDVWGVRAAAVAEYPMYRGVARLVGMEVLDSPESTPEKLDLVAERWEEFDFFFVHVKPMDSAGEDGDFERKARLIGEVDGHVPRLLDLGPDVLLVTGDHSTPATLRYHSWHPVPVLLYSPRCRPDRVERFGERACLAGALGPRFPGRSLMPLAMAHAGRLGKYGA